jgi:hypothetical protein
VFIALVGGEKKGFLMAHLPQMMEVALRVRLHGGVAESSENVISQSDEASVKESKAAATELLEALEKKVGSTALLGKYAEIQRRLQASKAEKKRVLASEAIKDPKAYAVRKVRRDKTRSWNSTPHCTASDLCGTVICLTADLFPIMGPTV